MVSAWYRSDWLHLAFSALSRSGELIEVFILGIVLGTIHKRRLLRGGGRGVAKLEFWGDFQGVFGETRGGRVVKNHEKWGDVFYGWSLIKVSYKF